MEPLMKSVNQTARCAMLYRNQVLEPYGLMDHQHAYIIHICQNPGIGQDELANRIHVNKSNVARQLQKLEENGLIYRSNATNNRKIRQVFPTKKGIEIFPHVKDKLSKWQAYLLEGFTADEQNLLCQMMATVMKRAIDYTENPEVIK